MRVKLYPEIEWGELGDRRWRVEWYEARPGADFENFEPDIDAVRKLRSFKTEVAAKAFAKKMIAADKCVYGDACVQEQVVDWFVEEDNVAEWADVGEGEYQA